ncbi:bifunctional diguanylate cyclase/phosphodiesterase [Aestuariibacter sp. GS-14]|uniref:putative bifunctional diguanylate cyclase/phosphodiesterase n=1 Tax=Aestuariibacter sp. GS-14 TaxID=2590670 RepID=UPI001126C0CA|nr:bifunctional diguanylate cyclase/phosphodiesterase [Aestuariibacter sp. GS-14]TPV57354.1 bifunctional diguanylate cyclase/phosphodiesterase [Aestuariibacter sp. GS-14]
MNNNNKVDTGVELNSASSFAQVRRHRLLQICGVSAVGLLASVLISRGIAFTIFSVGLLSLLIAFLLAYKHKIQASSFVLLSSMSAMLFALALVGAGLFDIAIIGYPCLLIFAAILGGVGLFSTLLSLTIVQCSVLVWLNLEGYVLPSTPRLSWEHLIFVQVIFIITGFSVYILVRDIKQLMISLQEENEKVELSRAQIQHLAHHDPLTRLPNRLHGELLFQRLLSQCKQNNTELAVLFLDLDNFKPVNDALGHVAGDILLEELAQRLSELLTDGQHLIRFGGDEFLVLVPCSGDCQNNGTLNGFINTLLNECAREFYVQQNRIIVSSSIGVAVAPRDGEHFKELCRKADIAMYQAKNNGRNTFSYYSPEQDAHSEERFTLLQKLRNAVNTHAFTLNYQPIIDLRTGNVVAVEALLRWPQPDGSMIGPDKFIPLAESAGIINVLGNWVIQQACAFCANQRKNGFPELRIAVNISALQFNDGKLKHNVEKALRRADLPPDALELELTESLFINESTNILSQLSDLTDIGVTIAIDDFGTGYSNLAYLRRFHACTLKIDRSFIHPLTSDDNDVPLVQAMITMASSLGMHTVAEGIEDKATLALLVEMGCGFGQGYHWSKPLCEDEINERLCSLARG